MSQAWVNALIAAGTVLLVLAAVLLIVDRWVRPPADGAQVQGRAAERTGRRCYCTAGPRDVRAAEEEEARAERA